MIKNILRKVRNEAANIIDVPAVILLYHRVTTLEQDPQLLSVTPTHFDEHLTILKRNYNVLSVEEFNQFLLSRKGFPKKCVLITFDDGYADNHLEARPILESHWIQALFYIATANISTPYEMWWDNLERIFLSDRKIPHSLSITINDRAFTFNTSSTSYSRLTYDCIHPLIRNCTPAKRDEAINTMLAWAELGKEGRASHRMMTFEELTKFATSKSVIIGAHTHNHPKLSACLKEEQYHEIASSKVNLEAMLGWDIRHFSYPFGTTEDYNADSISICSALGFNMVCSNFPRTVHRWTDRLQLPRMLVRDWPAREFELKMRQFFNM